MRHIWYVAYGSNLSRERFHHYLHGGRPHGNNREYPGCRDTSDPLDSFGLLIAGGVYFAGRSSGWRAGMAFYNPEAPGAAAVRAYLITTEQFIDVLAQETRRSPGMALDLAPAFRGSRYSNGVGGYPILVRLGARRGVPLMTFTRDWRGPLTLMAPTMLYLATMATGLREAHRWSWSQIDRYLSALPGVHRLREGRLQQGPCLARERSASSSAASLVRTHHAVRLLQICWQLQGRSLQK